MIRKPKGTNDITPDQMGAWNYIRHTAADIAARFGYGEIITPIFEFTELFARGMGEVTDVVQKEMYTFPDREERSMTLRPEGTAGVVRAAIEGNLLANALPLKLFYIASCFRYERPQAGRSREFYQFGVELFGSESPAADGEVITLVRTLLDELGIGATLHINSIGCPDCRPAYRQRLVEYFTAHIGEMCQLCATRLEKNPLRLLDCKNATCSALGDAAPKSVDYLCQPCEAHQGELEQLLSAVGVEYMVDTRIVRGLDYYTRTVFEFISSDIGAQSTICGGGRMNGLVKQLGGAETPMVGFGVGISRLVLALESAGKTPPTATNCDLYIACMGKEAEVAAFVLIQGLRKAGVACDMDIMGRSVKSAMRHGDKLGAKYTMVLGETELAAGSANLRHMSDGTNTQVTLSVEEIKKCLKMQ